MAGSIENNCLRVTHPIIPRSDNARTVPQYIKQQRNTAWETSLQHDRFDNIAIQGPIHVTLPPCHVLSAPRLIYAHKPATPPWCSDRLLAIPAKTKHPSNPLHMH